MKKETTTINMEETIMETKELEEVVLEEDEEIEDVAEEEAEIAELNATITDEEIDKINCTVDVSDVEGAKLSDYAAYLRDIRSYPVMTSQESARLLSQGKAAKDAGDEEVWYELRNRVVMGNVRLVIHIAKQVAIAAGSFDYISDMISEGNSGLMKACDKFSPENGARFGTYAWYWIRQAIQRNCMDLNKSVHIPYHITQQISAMWKSRAALEQAIGHEPSDSELADYMGGIFTAAKIAELKRISSINSGMASLDQKLGDDADSDSLNEVVGDSDNFMDDIRLDDKQRAIFKVFNSLDIKKKELIAVFCSFGACGFPKKTYDQIAQYLYDHGMTKTRVSHQRIEQMVKATLERVQRNPKAVKALRDAM